MFDREHEGCLKAEAAVDRTLVRLAVSAIVGIAVALAAFLFL